MAVVLGIDAAWTAGQPSGVALLRSRGRSWDCVALAPSYASFLAAPTPARWATRPVAGPPDCAALHAKAIELAGAPPDVIAIDMPLATHVIRARRAADNAICRAYAARGLGAHSPTPERPGPIAELMRRGFGALGYAVATTATSPRTPRVLIEAFPHAAAIELLDADYRVPYKLGRLRQYWPDRDRADQRRLLLAQWTKLRRALARDIRGGELRVPTRGTLAMLKRYEDALDALICAWLGAEYLAGRLHPHGDHRGAVWAHASTKI